MNFNKRLKIHLKMFGISQIELSRGSRLTPAGVSQILSGKRDPSLGSIIKIMKFLDKRAPQSLDFLIRGKL